MNETSTSTWEKCRPSAEDIARVGLALGAVLLFAVAASAGETAVGRGYSVAQPDQRDSAKNRCLAAAKWDALRAVLSRKWGDGHFGRWEDTVREALERSEREFVTVTAGDHGAKFREEDGILSCAVECAVDWGALEAFLQNADIPAPGTERPRVVVVPDSSTKPKGSDLVLQVGEQLRGALHDFSELSFHIRDASRARELNAVRTGLLPLASVASPAWLRDTTLAGSTLADVVIYYRVRDAGKPRQSLQGDWRVKLSIALRAVRSDNAEEVFSREVRGIGRAVELESAQRRAIEKALGGGNEAGAVTHKLASAIASWWKAAQRDGIEYTISLSSHLGDSGVFTEFVTSLKRNGHRVQLSKARTAPFGTEFFYEFRIWHRQDNASLAVELENELNRFLQREGEELARVQKERRESEERSRLAVKKNEPALIATGGVENEITANSADEATVVPEPDPRNRFARLSHAAGYHLVFSVYCRDDMHASEEEWQRLRQSPSPIGSIRGGAAGQQLSTVCDRVKSGVVFVRAGEGSNARLATGFMVDPSGLVFTSRKLVEKSSLPLTVRFHDGDERPARWLRSGAQGADVALIRVERVPDGVYSFNLGNDADIEIGEVAVIVGQPSGASWYHTSGVLTSRPSARGPRRPFMYDMTTYYGSAGSPVFRFDGGIRVIGIHSAAVAEASVVAGAKSSGNDRLIPVSGFALGSPVSEMKKLLNVK